MTFIGKLFVMINLTISLLMAAAAFGIWANGIDWTDRGEQGGQPAGKLAALSKEISTATSHLALVESSWNSARGDLLAREDKRSDDRLWHDAEMAKLVGGKDKTVQMVDPTTVAGARPNMVDAQDPAGQPLATRDFYDDKMKEHQTANRMIRENLDKKVKENEGLVKQLAGDKETDPEPRERGIRRRLTEERVKRQGVVDEQGITESLQINMSVESQLIIKRLEAIDERIEELTKYLKKKHGVDVPAKWR